MSLTPVLSIIIPVYNGQAFIKRTIQSVINQELDNWELIVVNDGSIDQSESIVSNYCTLDTRITLISQVNKGLSAARNVGYKKAKGKYIAFLDADDYVEPDYYKSLIDAAENTDAEFIVSSYIRDFVQMNGTVNSIYMRFEEMILDSIEEFRKQAENQFFYNIYIHVWNKIYRKAFLEEHQIYFDESIRYAEDVPYNIWNLKHATKIMFVDIPGYHYICHQKDRLTGKWKDSLPQDNGRVYKQIIDFEQRYWNIENSEIASGMYLRSCFLAMEKAIHSGMSYHNIKHNIQQILQKKETEHSLRVLKISCKSKEFLIYRFIMQIRQPEIFLTAVKLRMRIKNLLKR